MKNIRLGRSELEVSPIAFGTWQLGGDWGATDEEAAVAAIRRAAECGINFFDTAQAYGFGASESLLARALKGRPRDEVVIATKGGLRPMAGGGIERDASPDWIRRGVDSSLKALGTDYIDLYQIHWPDPKVPFAETAGALADLKAAGKIRHVGVSNYDAAQMAEFSRTLPVETLQPVYHMFRRDIEESVLPYTKAHGIGVLAYGPSGPRLAERRPHPRIPLRARRLALKERRISGRAIPPKPESSLGTGALRAARAGHVGEPARHRVGARQPGRAGRHRGHSQPKAHR